MGTHCQECGQPLTTQVVVEGGKNLYFMVCSSGCDDQDDHKVHTMD